MQEEITFSGKDQELSSNKSSFYDQDFSFNGKSFRLIFFKNKLSNLTGVLFKGQRMHVGEVKHAEKSTIEINKSRAHQKSSCYCNLSVNPRGDKIRKW